MKVESLKFLFIGMGLTQALFFLTAPFFKKISHYILILFAVSTSYYIYFSEPLISGKGLEFLFFQLSSITLAYSILYHFFENRINVIYKIAFILLLFLSVGLYFPVSRGNDFIYHNARFIVLLLSLLSLRLLAKELKPEIRKIFLPSYILWCLSVFNDFLILSGVYTFSLLSSYGMFIFLLSFSYYRIKLLSSPETSQSNVILKNELETIQTQVENEYYPIIQLAAEISVISYFVVNKDASICYANKAAAEIIGFTREELLQMSYLDINPDFNPKSWEEHWQTLKEQTSFTYISLNQTKENILIPVEITDNYISSHSKEYCLSIIQDIRKRKKAEEDLREEKEKAEEATRLKDKFISLVSHDLRSPLSGMLAFFEMMIEDEDEFRPKDRKEMYLNFYNSIQSLLGMIDKLLNLNRLQSGRLTLQPEFIELKAILDDIIPQFHPLIQRKDITLVNQVKKQTKIFIDPNLFREVLTNLLSNAVKFCSAKDTIEIIPHEGDRFLEIKDSGKGIPEEFLPDLFKEEIKTTTIGTLGEIGTGLGLPFCKDIMEAHSGDI
ncbi:MAG: PAS domain S-box protein, partial [Leptospiraceae bacterium]|nr:PAS domain S-box protein [Leptospiraceae bacterium]